MQLSLDSLTELSFAFPDILMAVFTTILILYRSFFNKTKPVSKLSLIFSLIVCLVLLIYRNSGNNKFESSLFIYNQGLQDIKITLLSIATVVLLIFNFMKTISSDCYIFILGVITAINLCLISNNLLCLFIALELYTFSLTFVLLSNKAEEWDKLSKTALRFMLLSALMSAIFLFGSSLLYSQFGSLSYKNLILNNNFESVIGTALILSYLLFKLGVVPFHAWMLDIYEKLPFFMVMFLDAVWKISLIFIFLRIFSIFIINRFCDFQYLLDAIAIISMMVGGLIATFQNNINKFIASSSIGHIGFIIAAFSALKSLNQFSDIACYSLYYTISSICFFVAILIINKHQAIRNFSDIAGIANTTPVLGILILAAMFSMIGIPPFGNFVAKLNIFKLLIETHNYVLLTAASVYSVLSIIYTAKISKQLFMKTTSPICIQYSKAIFLFSIMTLAFSGFFYPCINELFSNIISRI